MLRQAKCKDVNCFWLKRSINAPWIFQRFKPKKIGSSERQFTSLAKRTHIYSNLMI